jgi:hypothetical protein
MVYSMPAQPPFLTPILRPLRAVARHQLRDLRGGGGGDADGLFSGYAEHLKTPFGRWFQDGV